MSDRTFTVILLGCAAILATSLILQEESIGLNLKTFGSLPGLIGITLILLRKNYKTKN